MPMLTSTVPNATAQFYTFLPALSTSDDTTPTIRVSWLRLLAQPSSFMSPSQNKVIVRGPQSFIYASSTAAPANTAENAVFAQHDQAHKAIRIDLSQPIVMATTASNGTTTPATGIASTVVDTSRSSRDKMLIAHGKYFQFIIFEFDKFDLGIETDSKLSLATLMSVAFLIITPAAIIIARFFRHSSWFPAHAALQIFTLILVCAGFGLTYLALDVGISKIFEFPTCKA